MVVVVGSWLSGDGSCSWFLVVGCRYRWLFSGFGVGGCSWLLIVGCRCQWLKLVPGCRVSIIGCQLSGDYYRRIGCSPLPLSVPSFDNRKH
jgi:hypothetical protein